MAKYNVEMSFEFRGTFTVVAESPYQAREYIEKHCGLVIGGDIHSSLPDEDIGWDFPAHPEKRIHNIRKT